MKQEKKAVDKKTLSFFLIGTPTIIIVFLMMVPKFYWIAAMVLAFYQLILLKQFLENYYD
ncbi:MAG: hypothetical protein ACOC56_02565 [Atribacterota bacterium]